MKFFESEIYFDGVFKTEYAPGMEYGSGYCKDQMKYNRMRKRIKLLFGLITITYTVEMEYVPSHVWISTGCLGYDSSGWRSQWHDHPQFNRK